MAQIARRCCGESGGPVFRNSGRKRRNAPKTLGRSDTRAGGRFRLAWESLAELVHEPQSVLGALVGQMQVNHGGGDLLMTEQLLDHVQMRAGLQQMGGKAVAQRMYRSGGEVEFFAS